MELRPYQREAVTAVHREWSEGRRRTLLGQATGTGKTVEFSQITKDQVDVGERVLQLAHREELLTQASNKLKELTGEFEPCELSSGDCRFNTVDGSAEAFGKVPSGLLSDHYR